MAVPETAALPLSRDPAVLRGLAGDDVIRLIGSPRFRRAEDPKALWRYAGEGCVLDLYFRADGPVYRVFHYEFRADPRTKTSGTVDAPACFAGLARGAAGGFGG